jgi:hypothetical protein
MARTSRHLLPTKQKKPIKVKETKTANLSSLARGTAGSTSGMSGNELAHQIAARAHLLGGEVK